MIKLGIDRAQVARSEKKSASRRPLFLRWSWLMVLVLGFLFYDAIPGKIGTIPYPWLRPLFKVAFILIAGWLFNLAGELYLKYAPSIFERDDPED